MAKFTKDIKTIQKEKIRLKDDIVSVEDTELERRAELYLQLQKFGGRTTTKRDDIGNIILYEDPKNESQQLLRADQLVTVELIKPDYDDEEAKHVLDVEINELFTPIDKSEIARLRQQIEKLRNDLKNATGTIIIGDDKDPNIPVIPDFPDVAIEFPDHSNLTLSKTPLEFEMSTGIFNKETMTHQPNGSADPFTVNWWIINHTTEEILLSGVNDTLFEIEIGDKFNNEILAGNLDLDVVLQLSTVPTMVGMKIITHRVL